MHSNKARELLKKHAEGTLTEEEKAMLESWYLYEARMGKLPADMENIEEYLDGSYQYPRKWNVLWWAGIAASVLLVLSLSLDKWNFNESTQSAEEIIINDALPGDFRAQLTLANGKDILLSTVGKGKIAEEGGISILKTEEGELTYESVKENNKDAKFGLNTVRTPKAGQFQVVLSDGSVAWLNAESSIRFPAAFSAHERLIEVTGEVYFEVKKTYNAGKRIPFRVKTESQTVEVLGTSFNINSYADEGVIKTTLLEGSIKVNANDSKDKSIVLRPGQQAQLSSKKALKVSEVDTEQVMAWKEGYFRFNGVGAKELMQQIARWYDMEIEYPKEVREYEFVGEISRNTKLSSVLKILEAGGVKFKVEDKKIILAE